MKSISAWVAEMSGTPSFSLLSSGEEKSFVVAKVGDLVKKVFLLLMDLEQKEYASANGPDDKSSNAAIVANFVFPLKRMGLIVLSTTVCSAFEQIVSIMTYVFIYTDQINERKDSAEWSILLLFPPLCDDCQIDAE